ncbi:MAG: histone deacetylase, partial [Deltaproteobacteria bacterium]|nr:histone deacetylase [Deltaproteobacteria bacterium]
GFAGLTRILMDIAGTCCEGRLLLVLEGGYNVMGQKESVRAVLNELSGTSILGQDFLPPGEDRAPMIIKRAKEVHKKHWACLR